jgi:four helix bundle protein
MHTKINTFRDLIVWQHAHKLVLEVYIITKLFPKEELFCLTSQLRRAAISVSSNIAEGFGRKTEKDRNHFYQMSLGSLYEVHNQIIIVQSLQYITTEQSVASLELIDSTGKLLHGILKASSHIKSLDSNL